MLDLSLYKFIIFFISLYFIITRVIKFRRKEHGQSLFKLLVTIIIWGSLFAFTALPNIRHMISSFLGVGDDINTLVFTGFIIIFVVIFKLLSIIETLEKNISDLVRQEALEKLKK